FQGRQDQALVVASPDGTKAGGISVQLGRGRTQVDGLPEIGKPRPEDHGQGKPLTGPFQKPLVCRCPPGQSAGRLQNPQQGQESSVVIGCPKAGIQGQRGVQVALGFGRPVLAQVGEAAVVVNPGGGETGLAG